MGKTLLLFIGMLFSYLQSSAQAPQEKVIYIVDSIPVIKDPEEGNDILQSDISDVTVIKNKDTLKILGYQQFDAAFYLFTKAYRSRPDSLKKIPSSKQMKRKNGVWLLNGDPYTGTVIDYYYSGQKLGEGQMVAGKINGLHTLYYKNGNISAEVVFRDGIEDGLQKIYYEDRSIKQKGLYVNGKEAGPWEEYYPNGQVKLHNNYTDGQLTDSAFKYYSNGKIKERVFIKNGNVIPDPALAKIDQLMNKSAESNKQGDFKSAIKYCSKVIDLDSTYAEAWFARATLKLNNFQFDDALADFDQALKFEPFMETALTNRAFARIRKYQFAGSRTLSRNSEVTVMASKDKMPVPTADQEKICNDLHEAVFLGDRSKMITEALNDYCQSGTSN